MKGMKSKTPTAVKKEEPKSPGKAKPVGLLGKLAEWADRAEDIAADDFMGGSENEGTRATVRGQRRVLKRPASKAAKTKPKDENVESEGEDRTDQPRDKGKALFMKKHFDELPESVQKFWHENNGKPGGQQKCTDMVNGLVRKDGIAKYAFDLSNPSVTVPPSDFHILYTHVSLIMVSYPRRCHILGVFKVHTPLLFSCCATVLHIG